MTSNTTLDHDETLKLGHGDAALAKAPARKFETRDLPDRSLLSPGIFAVLSMGIGAYLGQLREIVNPAPNTIQPEGRPPLSPEQGLAPVVEPESESTIDIAAFWQEIQQRYEDAIEQLPQSRRLYSAIRFNSEDYFLEGAYAPRPFQGVSIDVAANGFRFATPTLARPKFDVSNLPALANTVAPSTPAAPRAENSDPDDGTGTTGPGGPGTPVNRAPLSRGPVYLGSGLVNLTMLLLWADFARAAVDPDGDRLQITSITATSGEIRTYGSDAWIYVPERDKPGIVNFTFTIGDGKAQIQGQAFLDLKSQPAQEIIGTPGADVLLGTPGKDLIDARDGDDTVYGRDGDDLILGGSGDDVLIGGAGNDVIHGGTGHDRIFGGEGDDVLFGEAGNDMLFGEAGRDSLMGGDGQDVLSGGEGDDRLFGEAGQDVLSGEAGADVLDGGEGHDTMAGGAGEDVMIGDAGNDTFVAGIAPVLSLASDVASGDPDPAPAIGETFFDGNDVIHGGEGSDTYDLSAARQALVIDLENGTASGAEIGTDRLTSIETIVAGSGNDTIIANQAVNVFYGGGGDDRFIFGSVASLSNAGQGFDQIRDFDVGDKVDLSRLERELGRLYFADGEMSAELDDHEHKTLVKLYKKMIDDDDSGHQVLQLITDIDGDADYEIVIISAQDLDADDLILTAYHLPGQVEGLVA